MNVIGLTRWRQMRIQDLEAFRAEVRAFLDENLTPELRDAAALQAGVYAEGDVCRNWHRILYQKGWIAPSWPEKYGGPGWTPIQRMIFESECAAAGAPVLPGMSILMCGPVLIRFWNGGTEEFLPAKDPVRRTLLVPGLLGAAGGLGSRVLALRRGSRWR